MSAEKRIEELIEASSLGTPAAVAMRARTSPEVARRIVARSKEFRPFLRRLVDFCCDRHGCGHHIDGHGLGERCYVPGCGCRSWRDHVGCEHRDVAAEGTRCPSCDHLASIHQPDGCWYTVADGAAGRDLVCPCSVAGGR